MKRTSNSAYSALSAIRAFLSLFILFPLFVLAQSSRYDIDIPEQELKTALLKVSEITGYRFSYSESMVPAQTRVKLKLSQASLEEILKPLLPPGIEYLIKEKEIILYQKRPLFDPNKRFTISGYVREQGSEEALLGVHVYVKSEGGGTVSNAYGFYALTLASDSQELNFSYVGYQSRSVRIALLSDTVLNIELNHALELAEVVVQEKSTKELQNVQGGKIALQSQEVKNMPALLGEKDVMKECQQLPGVQGGSEGQSGFFVRGGNNGQNLVILDDAPVYYAFHALGFLSVFNGDAIKSIELNKGSFPARYGGRVSSVLDINMKEGHREAYHGEFGLSILSGRGLVEGPIQKGKSSFMVSGRRSYLDLLIRPFLPGGQKLDLSFHDLTAKVNWDIGAKDKLYLSFYRGRDKFGFGMDQNGVFENSGLSSGNTTGTLRWNKVLNAKLFVNTSLIFSNFNTNFFDERKVNGVGLNSDLSSGIRDWSLKSDFDLYYSNRHRIRFGTLQTYHYFRPRVMRYQSDYSGVQREITETFHSWEGAWYIEDEYSEGNWIVNGGFRLSHFLMKEKGFINPEPRLSALYRLLPGLHVKTGYARMSQYVHQLSNTGLALFTDLWVPSSDLLPAQTSDQVSFGLEKIWPRLGLQIEVETYYKQLNQIVGYREGANFVDIADPSQVERTRWEENVISGSGKSYGMELFIKRSGTKYSGWLAYTWSKSFQTFDEVNEGNPFYAPFDRRHCVNIVQTYKIKPGLHLTATWTYQTGRPVTLPQGEYFTPIHDPSGNFRFSDVSYGYFLPDYAPLNSFRMRAMHRLDIALQFIKKYKTFERNLELSVYNVYANRNPLFYSIETDITGENRTVRSFSLFPLPIPVLSYSLKF